MTGSPLSQLAAALHWRVIAVIELIEPAELVGYFDESGTHKEAPVTGIAGYLGPVSEWNRVESLWREELQPFAHKGLKTFHMSECRSQAGECARLEKFELQILQTRLSDILENADLKAFGFAVDVPDWDAITTPRFRAVYPKPYDLCFQSVVAEIELWHRYWGEGNESVALVFGVQDEYQGRALTAFQLWKKAQKSLFSGITHAYPRDVPALQATDMLVNATTAEWRGLQTEGPSPSNHFGYDPLVTKITKRHGMKGGLYDYRRLTSMVREFERVPASSQSGDRPA
jgi:hypothetical protein